MKKLQAQGKNVFLVSGGFRQVIHPIAESLNIPVSNVFANNLLFKVSKEVHLSHSNHLRATWRSGWLRHELLAACQK